MADTDDKKQKNHAYYLAHPEIWQRANENAKARYVSDPAYRAKRKSSYARYAEANPGKLREKNKRMKNNRRSQPSGKLDYIFRNARGRARKRGLRFDDDVLVLARVPPLRCPCCDVELDYRIGVGQSPRTPSLDRTVSSDGYVIGNVAIICMRCNAIKNDGSAEEHRRIADYIDQRRREHVDSAVRSASATTE